MVNRHTPVIELGYQRCSVPPKAPNNAPNALGDKADVGGDIIVAFKHGFSLPIYNTVVANNARISFLSDSFDHVSGGEYIDAYIRTDLLRIRNRVEFYTDPAQPNIRKGKFVMATPSQMDEKMVDPGMYTRHLHMEAGSELSIPGEDSLVVLPTTVVGGYGHIHENVMIKANGILAPGFASLMEYDCQTPYNQGTLTMHNLYMEKDAVLRISMSNRHQDSEGNWVSQTDTLVVHDTIYMEGKIPLVIMTETRTVDPGCYLFMEYDDSNGTSSEYVRNLVLVQQRYENYYFSLDYSVPGKIYLCITEFPVPEIQRFIDIREVSGVVTEPAFGKHWVKGYEDFSFTAKYSSGTPYKVTAVGYYSGTTSQLDEDRTDEGGGVYRYYFRKVIQPWTVYIGPELSSNPSANEDVSDKRVWSDRNILNVRVESSDVVTIASAAGLIFRKEEIPAGLTKYTLDRGVYFVTLKDGSAFKVIIR